MFTIYWIKKFSPEEKKKIEDYLSEVIDELGLHHGYNCGIDVSDAIGRTANVDIEVLI